MINYYSKSIVPIFITDDYEYEYTICNNAVTITKYLGNASEVTVPETIEDYPVVTIGTASFINNTQLSSITLSNVYVVEDRVFSDCTGLINVIGENVVSIGAYGFYNCVSLKNISIPDIKTLDKYCFAKCSELESIDIPLTTELPDSIFSNCYKLKNIDISKIKTIGEFAFENSMALEEIYLSEVTSIDNSAFCYSGIKPIDFKKVESIGSEAFIGCENIEDISLPAIKEIGKSAFRSSGISSLELPSKANLGNKAFSSCISLQCIWIAKEIGEIGTDVFSNCKVNGLTIDYGQEDISLVTEEDWYTVANKLTGLEVDSVIGRFIKSDIDYIKFTKDDTDAPEITILGDNPMTLEVGVSNYTEMGASVTDNSCEVIEPVILVNVNTKKIGQYSATYTATDFCGNSLKVERRVNVIDTTAPVITLIGNSHMFLEVGLSKYVEPGAKVTDNSGEILAPNILGEVNTSNIGQYSITYIATDSSGNKGKTIRNVEVIDTTAPVITLNGSNPMVLEVGLSKYNELGASVTDNSGENIAPVITGTVNTSKIGQNSISYKAVDSSGNENEITRTINVIDTTPPVITLVGDNPVTIEQGTPYNEEGADVIDNSGEKIVPSLHGFADYNKIGKYTLTYNATDSSGNNAIPVERVVNVVEKTIKPCSQIVAYNNRDVITKWALYTLDDKLIYETDNYLADEQCIINLDNISELAIGTQLYLKAIVSFGWDGVTNVTLEYEPHSNTTYFELRFDDSDSSQLLYHGIIYSDGQPPTTGCDKISTGVLAWAAGIWEFYTLDDKLLFTVGPYPIGNLVDLAENNVEPGTILKVKAFVEAGVGSTLYLHFIYYPNYNVTPEIILIGTAFKTCIMFVGFE